MANDDQDPSAPPSNPSGTANLLKHYTQYAALEQEYDPEVAAGLMRKALERKGVEETVGGVKSWAAISTAIVTKQVDLAQEVAHATAQAEALVNGFLNVETVPEGEFGVDGNPCDEQPCVASAVDTSHYDDETDDYDDESDDYDGEDDDYDPRPSVSEIYNVDSEEDALDEAYDDALKLIEKP